NVASVLKGEKTLKDCVLHHYRTADGTNVPHVPNGPTFVHFATAGNSSSPQRTYLLFLIREADSRYAPVVGQTDPGRAARELVQTIKPGMTRADLSKKFFTEGGISTVAHRTYVYRDYPNVKVALDFTLS